MSNVIAFRAERRTLARPAAAEGARILLFTGIRYVRDEGAPDEVMALVHPQPMPMPHKDDRLQA